MPNYLYVQTRTERPQIYLIQDKTLDQLREEIRTQHSHWNGIGRVFELKPDTDQRGCPLGGFKLRETLTSGLQSAAEAHLAEALYFASIDGSKTESEVLGRFADLVIRQMRQAKEREDRVARPPQEQPLPKEQTTV